MQTEDPYWQACRLQIEAKLGWGPGHTWQSADFETLSERIADQTQVKLSVSTLRRLWGRVRYEHLPSVTTLNTLALFVGHVDWRSFRQSTEQRSSPVLSPSPILVDSQEPTKASADVKWVLAWTGIGLVVIGALLAGWLKGWPLATQQASYAFASRAITRSIPNSVVFTYDATAAPTDSVFIQQSWDPARRQEVARMGHQHTSLYYYPGSYEARLLIGSQIVKKHSLLIPTKGWLGLIDRKPVPIYLPAEAIGDASQLAISMETIRAQGVTLSPDPPAVHFYNVGNFEPLSTAEFSFRCQVRNSYGQGAGICQRMWIVLFTETSAISIPLSQKGCISSLKLFSIDTLIGGQSADLSLFGAVCTDWVRVRCQGDKYRLRFYVNEQLAYQLPASRQPGRIVGMAYGFEGTGAVRRIELARGKQTVYRAF